MRRTSIVVLGLVLATATRAEIIEVPVPELAGAYGENGAVRSATVILPMQPAVINGVSLHVAGNSTLGEAICLIVEEPVVTSWTYDFVAAFEADPGRWISGAIPPADFSGPFTSTRAFFPSPSIGTTWDFFLDGEAELTMDGFPAALVGLCGEGDSRPSVVVDTVTLIVDAEFTVPTASSTWGRIKALYH